MSGCSRVSPGCDHCYAEAIATSKRFAVAFPNGFDPTFKPKRLREPSKWPAARIFTNSMSDFFHEAFSDEEIDQCFAVMREVDRHDYLVLTKRPQRMAKYIAGWLERVELDAVPDHIWLGCSIESDRYTFRANHLRDIPVMIRFLSCEPLLGPLPSLDLDGISWVIVGGESGNNSRNYRDMD